MGVLNEVLKWKQYKDQEQAASMQAIPQAVQAFIQGRQQQQKNMMDMLQIDAMLAGKGLRRGPQGFERDESLESPIEKFIQQGQLADASLKMQQAGVGGLPGGQSFAGLPSVGGQGGGMLNPQGQLVAPQGQAQASQGDTGDSDWFATQATLNAANVPTSTTVKSKSGIQEEMGIKKEEAKQAKLGTEEAVTEAAASEQALSNLRFTQQFERSFEEIQKKIPGFGETGVVGKAKRGGAGVLNMLDELPETSTLIDSAEVFANRMVKKDEGGKITDKDRAVYVKVLVNTLTAPSDKNARLASNELVSLADRGAGIDENVVAFARSKNPVLKKIYQQTVESLPEYKVIEIENEAGKREFVTMKEAIARGAK